jgi:glycosyltransferase involved in cell wall biosynthesis
MTPKLSICIPTYNRLIFLKECLYSVLPQVRSTDEVEVIVIDNASPDDTQAVVQEFISSYNCLKYYRNEKNLGYAGNQVKCIEYATGDYMAFLCDDDVYLDGQVDRILKVISAREYAFVALNYYGFLKNKNKPHLINFAPDRDVTFQRAYDILNYPSVGHFSGLVFNARLAKETLAKILARKSYEDFEKLRGVIGDVAIRSTLDSNLPAYFIGHRGVANRMPTEVDYDNLYHQCLNYYEWYKGIYQEGLINKNDLNYRARLVIDRLPRAIISNGSMLNNGEVERITVQLSDWFKGDEMFDKICLPLLHSLKYKTVRNTYKLATNTYRYTKAIWYYFHT